MESLNRTAALTRSYTMATSKFIYAVSANDGKLSYGTVEREEIAGRVGYEITNRMGMTIRVDADSIEALIAALCCARDKRNPVTGAVELV